MLDSLLSPGTETATTTTSISDTTSPTDANSLIETTTPTDTTNSLIETTTPTDNTPLASAGTPTIEWTTPSVDTTTPTDNVPLLNTAISSIENTTTATPPVQQNIPAVQNPPVVTKVISPILSGNFKTGVVPIMVIFDRPIVVSGDPRLILSTGSPATTAVDYKSSSRNLLLFLYHISPGNYSSDLSYSSSSALVLNGGQIEDESGNAANLTLPQPGSPSSLSGYSNIVINAAK